MTVIDRLFLARTEPVSNGMGMKLPPYTGTLDKGDNFSSGGEVTRGGGG